MKKLFVVLAIVAAILPAIFVIHEVGGLNNWHGVMPEGITDSLYYYSRIHEVVDGHPLIGNPYVFEYRDSISPAFFLPDIVAAIPVLVGLPFALAMVFNVFVWSLLFFLLSFALCKQLKMPTKWAFVWSIFLFLGSYSFLLRPVVMQMVYPMYLAFLLVMLRYVEAPLERHKQIALAVLAALSFYVYTYLAYLVILTFGFVFVWYLYKRQFQLLRSLIITGLGTGVLLVPFAIFTWTQIHGAYYFETLRRLGLVYTHIPSIEAFYYGRWVVLGLVLLALLWKFFPSKEHDSSANIFWLTTGFSLFVGLFLNVITGAELTLAIHIGRFALLWAALALGVGLYRWYSARNAGIDRKKFLLVGFVGVILLGGMLRNIPRGLVFFISPDDGNSIASVQSYSAPLGWLNQNASGEVVVWANASISAYIPILTKHYPMFASSAALHSISNTELENRYLLEHSLETVTLDTIKADFGKYSAAGPNKEQPLAQNRQAWLCSEAKYFISTLSCPTYTDAVSLRGDAYFNDLFARFKTIQKNRALMLEQFHVEYLIVDLVNDHYNSIPPGKVVYNDKQFEILRLSF